MAELGRRSLLGTLCMSSMAREREREREGRDRERANSSATGSHFISI